MRQDSVNSEHAQVNSEHAKLDSPKEVELSISPGDSPAMSGASTLLTAPANEKDGRSSSISVNSDDSQGDLPVPPLAGPISISVSPASPVTADTRSESERQSLIIHLDRVPSNKTSTSPKSDRRGSLDRPHSQHEQIHLDRRPTRPDGHHVGETFHSIGGIARRMSHLQHGQPLERRMSSLPLQEQIALRKTALQHAAAEDVEIAQRTPVQLCWQLRTDAQRGLSSREAEIRLEQSGKNELESVPPPTFWEVFIDQFKDVVIIILLCASIASIALQEYEAGVLIIIIVVLNALLGVRMEISASAALMDLKNSNPPTCEVMRDGQVKEVPSSTLVPGDIVVLGLGKKVPADMLLTESAGLMANEMPLTGESVPCKKEAGWVMPAPDPNKQNEENREETELNPRNLVFMGCLVEQGGGKGVVVKTGMKTRMGSIQTQLSLADEDVSPLAKKLTQMGAWLGAAAIAASALVMGLMLGVLDNSWLDGLLVAVSLVVAAVPEGLPVCVTIALAVGMRTMAKKYNAQTLKLKSVETLGSASVICTDKTGTLTKGEMTAVGCWVSGLRFRFTGTGYDPTGVMYAEKESKSNSADPPEPLAQGSSAVLPILLGALNCNAVLQKNDKTGQWEATGNISERPIVVAAAKCGFNHKDVLEKFPRLKENPFDSQRKMMSTLHQVKSGSWEAKLLPPNTQAVAIVKGAPNVLLENCRDILRLSPDGMHIQGNMAMDPDGGTAAEILQQVDDYSGQAFRVLAVAYKCYEVPPSSNEPAELESGLTMAGLIASMDPDRAEVRPAIEAARRAGIRTVMITGDYVKTARAIAENVSILPRGSPPEKAVDCQVLRSLGARETELMTSTENQKEVRRLIREVRDQIDQITNSADVYARAKPEDKITIVRSLQRQGNICSMTGDGVNDAPALKQANIGVAMGITGTDVAKSAADMILLDDNFVSIVAAIRQGRIIYANIQKFCYYLLSTNVAEVTFMTIAVAIGLQPPLVPLQILWLNLATDGMPAVALAVEAAEPNVMEEGPRPQDEPLMNKVMLTGIAIQTVTLSMCTLTVYCFGLWRRFGKIWYHFQFDKHGDVIPKSDAHDLEAAQTMTILFIVFAELARAFGARSLRNSVFTIGPFSNWYMQPAVTASIVCTIALSLIPGVQTVFGMVPINGEEWGFLLAMATIPFTVDELTKLVYRLTGFGLRPLAVVHKHTEDDDLPDSPGLGHKRDSSLPKFGDQGTTPGIGTPSLSEEKHSLSEEKRVVVHHSPTDEE
eukprot:g25631.t1